MKKVLFLILALGLLTGCDQHDYDYHGNMVRGYYVPDPKALECGEIRMIKVDTNNTYRRNYGLLTFHLDGVEYETSVFVQFTPH